MCGILGAYLVARGIAEFFLIHYSDPASYRNDWGGPSLAGVFAVHSGPGVAVLIVAALYLLRRHRSRRRARPGVTSGAVRFHSLNEARERGPADLYAPGPVRGRADVG